MKLWKKAVRKFGSSEVRKREVKVIRTNLNQTLKDFRWTFMDLGWTFELRSNYLSIFQEGPFYWPELYNGEDVKIIEENPYRCFLQEQIL